MKQSNQQEQKKAEILARAEAADCRPAVEQCLQQEQFEGIDQAEAIIARVQYLRAEAKKYNIESAITGELRAGNFPEVVDRIRHARQLQQRRAIPPTR